MKVHYTPKMLGPAHAVSPSAYKPSEVVASWLKIAPDLEIIEPNSVTVAQFCLAHDLRFVSDVLAGRRRNGFGNTSPEIASGLPFTSGAMLAAAGKPEFQRSIERTAVCATLTTADDLAQCHSRSHFTGFAARAAASAA